MTDKIHAHLDALKLRKMREVLAVELRRAQTKKPSYSSFLLSLLRQEHEDKRRRALESRLKRARLPEKWSLNTYPWHVQTCISKKQHYQFAELDFIDRAENLVWIGGTGVGKTGLASSILVNALYAGRSGEVIKAQDLFEEFGASLMDRSTRRLLKRLSQIDVLVVDELGYVAPKPEQTNTFFRLIENRYRKKPTLVTSNLGYREWPQFLGNVPLAGALLRRLTHNCHTIVFNKGVNLDKPKRKAPADPAKG